LKSARAGNIISQIDSIKAAYYAFSTDTAPHREITRAPWPTPTCPESPSQVGGNGDGVVRDTRRHGKVYCCGCIFRMQISLPATIRRTPASLQCMVNGAQPTTPTCNYSTTASSPTPKTRPSQPEDRQPDSRQVLAEIDRKIDDGRPTAPVSFQPVRWRRRLAFGRALLRQTHRPLACGRKRTQLRAAALF